MKQILNKYIITLCVPLLIYSCNSKSGQSTNNNNHNNNYDNVIQEKKHQLNLEIGDRIKGIAIKVHDGDTYDLLIEQGNTIRIRMEGIDAPEGGMPYYRVSKDSLKKILSNETIEVQITSIDSYKRCIAYTYLGDGLEVSREMIKKGLAWHYKEYNDEKELSHLEKESKEKCKGLWQDYPYVVPPWTIRKLKWQGYKINTVNKALREHLDGKHVVKCPDEHLCDIIFERSVP